MGGEKNLWEVEIGGISFSAFLCYYGVHTNTCQLCVLGKIYIF